MEIHGWRTFLHPLFEKQLVKLTRQVERLKSRDPKGYSAHPAAKILSSIHHFIREAIPRNPDREAVEGHWLQVRFHRRYRLFYRISRERKVILYVWAHNDRDSRTGPYGAFCARLKE